MKPFGVALLSSAPFTKNYARPERNQPPHMTGHVHSDIPHEGMSRNEIDDYANNYGYNSKIRVYFCDTLDDAEKCAQKIAQEVPGTHCIVFKSSAAYLAQTTAPTKTAFTEKGMVPA